jgi:hypothetical protein
MAVLILIFVLFLGVRRAEIFRNIVIIVSCLSSFVGDSAGCLFRLGLAAVVLLSVVFRDFAELDASATSLPSAALFADPPWML